MPGHYNKKPMGMKMKKKSNTSNAVKKVLMPKKVKEELKKVMGMLPKDPKNILFKIRTYGGARLPPIKRKPAVVKPKKK